MTDYVPESVPFGDGSNQELREYLWRELLRISGTLGKYSKIQVEEVSVEPPKVQDGTILWADGTLFDPGDGAGFYGRRGMDWYKFDNEALDPTLLALAGLDDTPGLILQTDEDVFTKIPFEEDDWTPTLTFVTPGDQNIVYSTRQGRYQRIGSKVKLWFLLQTSTFTHTTAAGGLQITDLPFTPKTTPTNFQWIGHCDPSNIDFTANYTQVSTNIVANTTVMRLLQCGDNVTRALITTTNAPTGTNILLNGEIEYETAA